jgi:dihydroxyacetone kinase-like protein
MKKIINSPHAYVDEALSGIVKAYPNHFKMIEGSKRVVVGKTVPVRGKVGIVTGGGSGHLPLFLGYVGPGLADAVAVGNVFSAPSYEDIVRATVAADGGAGVLHLFGNYAGDVMAAQMAAEMAAEDGVEVETALVVDDVVSASRPEWKRRRAVAGMFFAYKIAGAKADTGAPLQEVAATTRRCIDHTRSMGVALSSCTIPAVGRPNFDVAEGQMEIGMGLHGEPGLERTELKVATETATVLTSHVVKDLPFESGDRVAVLVNGLGATPMEELFIIYDTVHDLLRERGIHVYRTFVGEYATSMEMAGCSISLLRLDDEMEQLLDMPSYSPFLLQAR